MRHQKLQTTKEISKRMSSVHLKGGKAEVMLAKALWHHGIRYRKNYRNLPGSPDIAITKERIAIFVDGEFWHGQDWLVRKQKLKRNREFWIAKIEENMRRDARNDEQLKKMGWKTIHFWEKSVLKNLDVCVSVLMNEIR